MVEEENLKEVPDCTFCGKDKQWNDQGDFWHCPDCDAKGVAGISHRGKVQVFYGGR